MAIDIIRRSLENTVANWPLLLTRLGELFLYMVVSIGAVLASAGPVIGSGIAGGFNLHASDPGEYIRSYVLAHPFLLTYLLLLVGLAASVMVGIHSYVMSGSYATYVAGERTAGSDTHAARGRFQSFDLDRWMIEARRLWWRFFILYNVAWGAFAIVILLPLIPIALLALTLEDERAAAAVGCGGAAVWTMLLLVSATVVSLWSQLALGILVRDDGQVGSALRMAWSLLWRQFATLLLALLILVALSLVVGLLMVAFLSGAEMVRDVPGSSVIIFPLTMVFSLAQLFFSFFISAWMCATFVAAAMRDRVRVAAT